MGQVTIDFTIPFSTSNDKLRTQVIDYANELNDAPAIIPAQDFLDFFKRDIFTNPDPIEFSTLTDEQKTCICMIYTSGLYTHLVSILSSPALEAVHHAKSGVYINQQYTEREFTYTARIKKSNEADEPELDDYLKDDKLLKVPIVYERLISSYFITPPLRVVFEHLIQIKESFYLLLEWFYNYLEHIEQISFDFKTYHSLYESVAKEDYDLFYSIVNNYGNKTISKLSIIVDLFYPTLHHFESQTTDYSHIIDNIRKNSHNLVYGVELTSSPINTLFNFLIIYIFRNCIEPYLSDTSLCIHYIALMDYSKEFVNIFNEWIEKETEEILGYFRNNNDLIEGSAKSTIKNSITNYSIQDNHKTEQVQSSGENPKQKDDNKPEPPENPQPRVDAPEHIKVHCGRKTLEKLINGLINGHKDETLGNFTPLVISKTGEDREAIKTKLICLFTGEGINDESIKWPYDLEWNDTANSLKLLVYLLLYEGIVLSLSDAVDENKSDGICEKIKTNFKGKKVWKIVGNALSYKSLRNKARTPKTTNISLMKKLASFYIDCQKLDD